MAATGLKRLDWTSQSDPYVEVGLIADGQEGHCSFSTTEVVRNSAAPSWNEVIELALPQRPRWGAGATGGTASVASKGSRASVGMEKSVTLDIRVLDKDTSMMEVTNDDTNPLLLPTLPPRSDHCYQP